MTRFTKTLLHAVGIFSLCISAHGQAHNVSGGYQAPTDPAVTQNLEDWQDLKFGLFMHWGTYSQWGIVESWTLCPEDEGWTQRDPKHGATYYDYVKNYENLQRSFNPTDFNPEKWAKAAKAAGMKYVVFTTKHHDGFTMFDTKESDYKITSEKTPFSKDPRADVTKEIFNTFRKDDFKIGAYFSKPDWHSEYFWWPYFPPTDRNINYNPEKYPDRWNKFKDFTYNQINELTSNYGKVDILWLDGGWVRPYSTIDSTVDWQRTIRVEQDVDMNRIGGMARRNQPGIIVVDRTVPGEWENYVTPEQAIPEHPLDVPWESCITIGDSFSYLPNDNYKPTKKIVETLVKIISRGGNYLLNVAPGPNGDFDQAAYDRLAEMAAWIDINGDAVYRTRAVAPYHVDNLYYTKSKDGKTVNVFHLDENDHYVAPKTLAVTLPEGFVPSRVQLLGVKGKVNWKKSGDQLHVTLPKEAQTLKHALALQLTSK